MISNLTICFEMEDISFLDQDPESLNILHVIILLILHVKFKGFYLLPWQDKQRSSRPPLHLESNLGV